MTYQQVVRPIGGLAGLVQVAIGLSAVAHALATQFDFQVQNPGAPAVFAALDALVLAGAAAAFISWLWQAWGNAEVIVAPRKMRWQRGWTIGSWFVPLADFVLPALVVANVADASSGWRRSSRRFVTLWWLLFLISQIAGRGYFTTSSWVTRGGEIVGYRVERYTLHSTLPLWIVMTVLEAAAAVTAILLVRRVTAMQTAAATAPSTAT
ncbi:MAG TPA: DUF4328 domain-containing protein [Kutzneria sp.]|jgi:hypothetical protein|nr:DUF4328 domain-containing protein [Kutzneria sp.]